MEPKKKTRKTIGEFAVIKEIGRGAFSVCYLAERLTGDHGKYVVKELPKKEFKKGTKMEELFKTELAIMQTIKHANIISLKELYEQADRYFVVMRYCSEGDLSHYMSNRGYKFFKEEDAVHFLKQIMNGFRELHRYNVMHRDFKLENIFVDSGDQLIIGDFGFAKHGSSEAATLCGTPQTMAPEILSEKTPYTNKVDLFSIGVVFYKMLFGFYPFEGKSPKEIYKEIEKKSGENLPINRKVNNISVEAEQLLKSLLVLDPKERIGWSKFFGHSLFDKHKPKPESNKVDQQFIENRNETKNSSHDNEELKDPKELPKGTMKSVLLDQKAPEKCPFAVYVEHEFAKSEIAIQAARVTREVSKSPKFSDYNGLLYVILIACLKKGLKMKMGIREAIEDQKGNGDWPGFIEFVNGSAGIKRISEILDSLDKFEKYESQVSQVINTAKIEAEHRAILEEMKKKTESLSTKRLNDILREYVNTFHIFSSEDEKIESSNDLKTKAKEIVMNVGYAVTCEEQFPIVNNQPLDWARLKSSMKKMKVDEMQEIIVTLGILS